MFLDHDLEFLLLPHLALNLLHLTETHTTPERTFQRHQGQCGAAGELQIENHRFLEALSTHECLSIFFSCIFQLGILVLLLVILLVRLISMFFLPT